MRYDQSSFSTPSNYSSPAPRALWPDAVAFREAIQNPQVSLGDGQMKFADVAFDRRGLPVAYSGRFAVVFRLTTRTGEKWALRCFTSPGEAATVTRALRYQVISSYVNRLSDIFVPFRYIEDGIKIGPQWYPVLAMRWATGEPLGRWVEGHLHDPDALRRLVGSLSILLARLESENIAHGDWQHDNLIVADEGAHVTLVDYDGLFVPEFAGLPATESGHPNYQHPARNASHFGPGLDRFACLVIETALLALAHDPALWERFSDGESLLFKKADLSAPDRSPVFQAVREIANQRRDTILAESLARLEDACRSGVESALLPSIDTEVLAPNLDAWATNTQTQTTESGGGGKWWQAGESRRVVAGNRTLTASGVSPDEFKFLARLDTEETRRTEQKYLWGARGGVGVFAALGTGFIAEAVAGQGHWPLSSLLPFLWVFNFAPMGYGKWPRKRIYEELNAEIAKMEGLIADRQKQIKEKAPLSHLPSAVSSARNVSEFVAEKLRATPITRLLTATNANGYTSIFTPVMRRTLERSGITNALELRQAGAIANLDVHALAALRKWCDDLALQAAEEYRKNFGTRGSVEIERLRVEVAEFERHVADLKHERDLFPDTSFTAYVRKVVGLPETPPAGTP